MADELMCYPRADAASAEERLLALADATSLGDVRSMVSLGTAPLGGYYPLRRAQADAAGISRLRDLLVEIAERHGFPQQGGQDGRAAFDREAAVVLHADMQIVPADAAQEDVWRWMYVWAVPDLLLWRFGKWEDGRWRVTADRVHRRSKGFLSRLWWRVELLGPHLAPRIGEDEAVALVERTAAIGYRDFGRILAREHLDFCKAQGISNRGFFLRDVMKRVVRRKSVVEVASLLPADAADLVRAILLESQGALGVGSRPIQLEAPSVHELPAHDKRLASPPTPKMSPSPSTPSEGQPAPKGATGNALRLDLYTPFNGPTVSLHVADPVEVNLGVLAILEVEGPATGRRVCRAYVSAAGMQHAGPQAKMDVKQSLEELVSAGEVVTDPVSGQSWERLQYRLSGQPVVRARTAGPRLAEEIPVHELKAVADSVPHDPWWEPEQLLRETLLKLGLQVDEGVSAPCLEDVLREMSAD